MSVKFRPVASPTEPGSQPPHTNPQAEEFKAALYHEDLAEADRLDQKYHFGPDEKLALCRDAFQYFLQPAYYFSLQSAQAVAEHYRPIMESEYQLATQAWYKGGLLSLSEPSRFRLTAGVLELQDENSSDFRVIGSRVEMLGINAACMGAYKETMMKGDVERGRKLAEHCKLNPTERKSVCNKAHRAVMVGGHLETGAQIARFCEWDNNYEKAMAEGIIEAIEDSNLDLAIQIAESFDLYYKTGLLKDKKWKLAEQKKKEEELKESAQRTKEWKLREARSGLTPEAGGLLSNSNYEYVWGLIKTLPLSDSEKNDWMNEITCSMQCNGKTEEETLVRSYMIMGIGSSHDKDWCKERFPHMVCWNWKPNEQEKAVIIRDTKAEIDRLMRTGQNAEALALSRAHPELHYHLRELERWDTNRRAQEDREQQRLARVEEQQKIQEERAQQQAQELAAREQAREERRVAREQARQSAVEADNKRKEYFIKSLVRADFKEAERLRGESRWSNDVLQSLVSEALVRATSGFRNCRIASSIYSRYSGVGGLCVPRNASTEIKVFGQELSKSNTCELDCPH